MVVQAGRLWENTWDKFIPFLYYDIEIRKVICSTSAIESLNASRNWRSRGSTMAAAGLEFCWVASSGRVPG